MLGIGQYSWSTDNVRGFSYVEANGEKVLDTTEGLGAFKDLLNLGLLQPYTTNLDIGGGAHDEGSEYLKEHFVTNSVYDPFMRPVYHNEQVLNDVKSNPVDTATSNSVLNVIDNPEARREHILLAYESLKEGGSAFFKVWPGDQSTQGRYSEGSYQSNQSATYYADEIASIFKPENIELKEEHDLIIATKK